MKKHNTLKVVLITILVLLLLTWILPAAYYSSGYVDQGRVQMGLFDLFSYPLTTLSYFGYLAIYVLVVGAFYGVLNKIGAYRTLLNKIASKFKNNSVVLISVIMVLLAILTSICGLQLGLILFFPMLISLILLMGYDKIVAALTVVGSTMIGIAGSTYAYSNTSIIASNLSLNMNSEIVTKIIILVLGLILLIFNTILYIKKNGVTTITKKEEKKSIVNETKKSTKTSKSTKTTKSSKSTSKAAIKDDEKIVVATKNENSNYIPAELSGKKHSIWPLVVVITLLFIVMVLAFISWTGAFNNKAFASTTSAVTEFKVFGFALFGKILGSIKEFGSWTVADMSIVVILATLLLSLIYKVNIDDMFDGIKDGVKKAAKPALITVLLYTCLVIVTYHPFQLVIYKAILGITNGFNALTTSIVVIIASILNIEPAYTFNSVLPYFVSVVTKTSSYGVVGVIFQSMYGLTMLFAPTSLILMMVLSYLDIPYGKWIKSIWKLLFELLAILAIIFIVLILI